jgi:hypothetical protein
MPDFPSPAEIQQTEHLSPGNTGDNISAKRVALYGADENKAWQRMPLPYIDSAFDYVCFSNPDGNGNYQTIVFNNGGSGGTTERTLTLAYDGNSNVTSIARA